MRRVWSRQAGMTLLELLAVISLGSMVVTVVGLSVSRVGPEERLDRAVELLRDVDQRARVLRP